MNQNSNNPNSHLPFSPSFCCVIIPAYQPEAIFAQVVLEIRDAGYPLVIIDDGSDQQYETIWAPMESLGAIVLHHDHNLGKGAALKTAFNYITSQREDIRILVTMDADGQHRFADMVQVCRMASNCPSSLILGVRHFSRKIPLKSKFGNEITKSVFAIATKQKVSDTQTGLRAFDRSLLPMMQNIPGDRYEYEMNVLLSCTEHGITIREVPIETVYADAQNSTSHFDAVRDSIRIYRHILHFAGASFICFIVDCCLFILFLNFAPDTESGILICNITARCISAVLNYTLNAKAVFKDAQHWQQTLPKYALLAMAILLGNSIVLTGYHTILGVPAVYAKLLTEVTLFVVSFIVQSRFIFRKKESQTHENI